MGMGGQEGEGDKRERERMREGNRKGREEGRKERWKGGKEERRKRGRDGLCPSSQNPLKYAQRCVIRIKHLCSSQSTCCRRRC